MNNRIVVTGASSEIGRAICEKITDKNSTLIVQSFKNKDHCNYLKKYAGKFEHYSVDFNDPESLNKFCEKIRDTDILINAAAYIKNEPLPFQQTEDIEKMINVNINSLIKICQTVIPNMTAKRKGIIINISSVTALRGNRGQAVYSGTKGFMESFSRGIAAEYGKKGIRVNCVAPGPVNSGSLKETLEYASKTIKESISLQRLGKPEDVANLVKFLLSDEASFITGKTLSVDGGFSRGV